MFSGSRKRQWIVAIRNPPKKELPGSGHLHGTVSQASKRVQMMTVTYFILKFNFEKKINFEVNLDFQKDYKNSI